MAKTAVYIFVTQTVQKTSWI